MNTYMRKAIAVGIGLGSFLMTATTVVADAGVSPTATPTSTATPTATPTGTLTVTPTPTPQTRVECTTGSYGEQKCITVKVNPTTSPKHEVVKAGLEENILMAMIAVFAISTVGFTYSKVSR